jgi:hypothetical protein
MQTSKVVINYQLKYRHKKNCKVKIKSSHKNKKYHIQHFNVTLIGMLLLRTWNFQYGLQLAELQIACLPCLCYGRYGYRECAQRMYFVSCICCSRNLFIYPLPSDDGYTYKQEHWLKGFMKYSNEVGSGASLRKIGLRIQKLMARVHRHTFKIEIARACF